MHGNARPCAIAGYLPCLSHLSRVCIRLITRSLRAYTVQWIQAFTLSGFRVLTATHRGELNDSTECESTLACFRKSELI